MIQQLRPEMSERKRELILRMLVASLAEIALVSATLTADDHLMSELEKMVDVLFRSLLAV